MSKKNERSEYTSLLTTLHRQHTSDIKNGLLSSLARTPSTSSLHPVLAQPNIRLHEFTSFPLPSSSSPAQLSPFSIQEEILAFADQHIRSLLPPRNSLRTDKTRRVDEDERDDKKDRQRQIHPSHEAPLVLSAVQVLSSALGLLAQQMPLERVDTSAKSNLRRVKRKRKRRENEPGWETVLRVLPGLKGCDDE